MRVNKMFNQENYIEVLNFAASAHADGIGRGRLRQQHAGCHRGSDQCDQETAQRICPHQEVRLGGSRPRDDPDAKRLHAQASDAPDHRELSSPSLEG